MSLVIFSCSPRVKSQSHTAAIVDAFKRGYVLESNEEVMVYYLNIRKEWPRYKKVFEVSTKIIFAMPLFVEGVPGLVMEFIEYLEPKKASIGEETRIGFILQGGFEEAHQFRTAEHYLEKLPFYLGCEYAGTLIKGGMFALSVASEAAKQKKLQGFYKMGSLYAKEERFVKEQVTQFAAPEVYSKFMIILSRITRPMNAVAWKWLAKKFGAETPLDTKPYEI